MKKSRKHFENKTTFVARNPKFSNKVEQKVFEDCDSRNRKQRTGDSGDRSLAATSGKKSRHAYPREGEGNASRVRTRANN